MSPSLAVLALLIAAYLTWGFLVLPREGWQMLAAVPVARISEGQWRGVNLTWYGCLTANAYLVAVVMFFLLMRSAGVPPSGIAILAAAVLACCVPASRLVARLVERKSGTFTVGGAVFVGIIAGPWVVLLLNLSSSQLGMDPVPVIQTLAAMAIAYTFGEGLGRQACISFGCCYGKRLADTHRLTRWLFSRTAFVFREKTRKIAYAHGMDGCPVVPIQAVTAVLYCLLALVSTGLFLAGRPSAACLLSILGTQLWRSVSETMRADYRGMARLSAYQVLALLGSAYVIVLLGFAPPGPTATRALFAGIGELWNPVPILLLQGLWLALFLYTGRSTVTGSELNFHVRMDRI